MPDCQGALKSTMPTTKKASRSDDEITRHYLIEKELASRLRTATKEERRHLYTEVYDELFRRVPNHPQLLVKPEQRADAVRERLALLQTFLKPTSTYLELGPGACSLAIEVANRVRKVYAVDVSGEITKAIELPPNLELIISDGSSVPVPENSVDIAYSDQLMEHLHPDDAADQLQNIYRALAPGGVYICITPNRLSGPHDISGYFDEVPTGFHLKEYSAGDLAQMFHTAGFRKVEMLAGARGFHLNSPVQLVSALESLLAKLPRRLGRTIARGLPLKLILGIKVVGTK